MVVDGVDIGFRIVEIRRDGRDELGAGVEEELLEGRDTLLTAGVEMSRARGWVQTGS